MTSPPAPRIVDVEPDDAAGVESLFPVLRQLRSELTLESFRSTYRDAYREGLRYTCVADGDRIVAVAGWRLVTTTYAGRKLYVDDLVTGDADRSRGFGAVLIEELARRAADAGCAVLDLDSRVARHDAHRFYFRNGFAISSYHFTRRLP